MVGIANEMRPEPEICNTCFLRNNILPPYLKTSGFSLSACPLLDKHCHLSAVSRLLAHLFYLFSTAVTRKQFSRMLSHSSSIPSEYPGNMIIKPRLKPVLILLSNEGLGFMSSFRLAPAINTRSIRLPSIL